MRAWPARSPRMKVSRRPSTVDPLPWRLFVRGLAVPTHTPWHRRGTATARWTDRWSSKTPGSCRRCPCFMSRGAGPVEGERILRVERESRDPTPRRGATARGSALEGSGRAGRAGRRRGGWTHGGAEAPIRERDTRGRRRAWIHEAESTRPSGRSGLGGSGWNPARSGFCTSERKLVSRKPKYRSVGRSKARPAADSLTPERRSRRRSGLPILATRDRRPRVGRRAEATTRRRRRLAGGRP